MFRTLYDIADPNLQLFWFCHAGAGSASLVRSARDLSGSFSLNVATYPGREDRYRDGLSLTLDELVDQFADELRSRVRGPFALIGHSFGSLLSYLLSHRLSAVGLTPAAMTVMTLASPNRVYRIPRTAAMTNDEFLDYLDNRFGGVPKSLRTNPEAINLFLPIVRYDLGLLESYVHSPVSPLPTPITALAGTNDKAVSSDDMADWKAFTSSRFEIQTFKGGHFFPLENVASVIDATIKMYTVRDQT